MGRRCALTLGSSTGYILRGICRFGAHLAKNRPSAVDLSTMRLVPQRPACRGQRCALPTAPAFAHRLHRAFLLLCQKDQKTYKGSRPFATPRFLAVGSE